MPTDYLLFSCFDLTIFILLLQFKESYKFMVSISVETENKTAGDEPVSSLL